MSKAKIASYVRNQTAIDHEFELTNELYKSDPKSYNQAWDKFLNKTEKCVESFKKNLNYFESIAAEGKAVDKYEVSETKSKLNSAKTWLSLAKSDLLKLSPKKFYPHFTDSLNRIKAQHPEYAEHFSLLDTTAPDAFYKSIGLLVTANVPRAITQQLNELPFQHPACRHLRLEKHQYAQIDKRARADKLASNKNVPVVRLSDVKAYVDNVYANRLKDPTDYARPFIAVEFCIGRRSIEVGLLSTVTPSKKPGHLKITGLAKQKTPGTKPLLDVPVLFLAPDQVLELLNIARERTLAVVFAGKKSELNRIKRERKNAEYNDLIKKVRDTFKRELSFPRINTDETRMRDDGRMHHITRGVYVQHASALRNTLGQEYTSLSQIEFANRILGHGEGDYETTLQYWDINLTDDLTESTPQAPKKSPAPRKKTEKNPIKTIASVDLKKIRRLTVAAIQFAKTKRQPGVIEIQRKMHELQEFPSMQRLAELGGGLPAARAYVRFLQENGIPV